MIDRKLKFEDNHKIGHMVQQMNTQVIKHYMPEQAIIETVRELWLTCFDREVLMFMPINEVEQMARLSFPELYPHLDKNLAQSFADDTIFHIAFKLSNQGKEVDFVDGVNS